MGSSIPDLEVNVNGEEIFLVNKRVLASYSGKIRKLMKKSEDVKGSLKVILNEFPGGAAIFEQILRFCYNGGRIRIAFPNVTSLSCAAFFMEMKRDVLGIENLCEKTERSLEDIQYWSWGEVIGALNECRSFLNLAISAGLMHKLLDSIVCRIALSIQISPSSSVSSSDSSSGCRFSSDTRSTESSFKKSTWWFEDVVAVLQPEELIKILVDLMILKNLDNAIVARFLFYYQRSRCSSASTEEEKISSIETVVEMLSRLDVSTLSHKSLFRLLQLGSSTNITQRCRSSLEHMIGSRLDNASLDSLLVPAPLGADHLYDVKLVLRLLNSFLSKSTPSNRMKKVASLIDMYMMEVAPDPHLKPAIFTALVDALPDSARESLDGVCDAVKLYLKVHPEISDDEKTAIRSGLGRSKWKREADVFEVRSQLQGMQWRAMELEKVCNELGMQMATVMKAKLCT